MTSRNLLRAIALAATLAVGLPGLATAAGGLYTFTVTATVPVGLNPDDMHLTFAGTGGTIAKLALVAPAGAAAVSGGGNTVDVTLDAKAAAGTDVTVTFVTNHSPISLAGGTWTNGGEVIGSVDDVRIKWANRPAVPGASTGALVALGMLMVGVGAFVIRRRQAEMA